MGIGEHAGEGVDGGGIGELAEGADGGDTDGDVALEQREQCGGVLCRPENAASASAKSMRSSGGIVADVAAMASACCAVHAERVAADLTARSGSARCRRRHWLPYPSACHRSGWRRTASSRTLGSASLSSTVSGVASDASPMVAADRAASVRTLAAGSFIASMMMGSRGQPDATEVCDVLGAST